jgi:hypothetical protein
MRPDCSVQQGAAENCNTRFGERSILVYRDYVDLLKGDILTAIMLSVIVRYYLPDQEKSCLTVCKDTNGSGPVWWLARSHVAWAGELGFTSRQIRRCLQVLEAIGLIETKVFQLDGTPTVHLRLICANAGQTLSKFPSTQEFADCRISGNSEPQPN